ncbi:MAG: RNA polymerase sigma factor [Planctomycetia bacterium]|nr:RNA polymerase sigma factor [Planctomycetia bacterium]
MFETSHSLIDQLCNEADAASWERLVGLYSPLLRGWIDRYDVQATDADDLIQDVLMVLMRELPSFRHSRQPGAFRSWMKRIVINRLRNFWRARGRGGGAIASGDIMCRLDEFEDDRSRLSHLWQQEHDQYLTRQLLAMIEPRFTASTRQAFRRLVLDGADADDVAKELGLSLNAVFTAKSRVLRELRAIGKGLLD